MDSIKDKSDKSLLKKRWSAEKSKNISQSGRMAIPSSDEKTDHLLSQFVTTSIVGLRRDSLLFIVFAFIQVLGVVMISLCAMWGQNYLDGYLLDTPKRIFNYHPLLMTIGMIYLNANGILIYRISRWLRFKSQKLIHFMIQTSALIVSLLGIYAVFHFHIAEGIPHLNSWHSWLGITTLSVFGMSLIASFFMFLYPGIDPYYQRLILPLHIIGGIANMAMTAAVAVGGLREKALISLKADGEQYKGLPPVALMFGCAIVVFTVLVLWLVTKPEFKKRFNPGVNKS